MSPRPPCSIGAGTWPNGGASILTGVLRQSPRQSRPRLAPSAAPVQPRGSHLPVRRSRRPLHALPLLIIAASGLLLVRCSDSHAGSPSAEPAQAEQRHLIAEENALPGATDWQIQRPSLVGEIQGYAGEV